MNGMNKFPRTLKIVKEVERQRLWALLRIRGQMGHVHGWPSPNKNNSLNIQKKYLNKSEGSL
jgi:hypothetical protein